MREINALNFPCNKVKRKERDIPDKIFIIIKMYCDFWLHPNFLVILNHSEFFWPYPNSQSMFHRLNYWMGLKQPIVSLIWATT